MTKRVTMKTDYYKIMIEVEQTAEGITLCFSNNNFNAIESKVFLPRLTFKDIKNLSKVLSEI